MFVLGVGASQRLFLMEAAIRLEKKKPTGIPNSGTPADYYPNLKPIERVAFYWSFSRTDSVVVTRES